MRSRYRINCPPVLRTLTMFLFFSGFLFCNAQNFLVAPFDISAGVIPSPVKLAGETHLFYELHLTNVDSKPWAVLQLEVFSDKADSPLAKYAIPSLRRMFGHPGLEGSPNDPILVGPGSHAILYLDIRVDGRQTVPGSLKHRFLFSPIGGDSAKMAPVVVEAPLLTVYRQKPLEIRPPVKGGHWVAVNGPSDTSVHRRVWAVTNGKGHIAQRFAIDWGKIGEDGHPYHGDPTKNSSWYGYGSEVLAVAQASVVEVWDGIPENTPFQSPAVPITVETVAGNHIILDLGNGRFALYAHLKTGSVRVKVGQKVDAGDVLGLIGNSGNADLPHLHFQVMDANSPLGAEGLPYVFKTFRLEGVAVIADLLDPVKTWKPVTPAIEHRDEIPFENAIVAF
ncbi:MAG: M23 family metallopeptidase [Puia sp.]|nr:M23 family metallopeptidase [Puia sp.]